MMMLDDGERFNVLIVFPDGSHNYERRWVPAKEAVECAFGCTRRPAVLLGMIRKVIITDKDDLTCFLWEHGKGVVFPTREQVMFGNLPNGVEAIDVGDPAALHNGIKRNLGED